MFSSEEEVREALKVLTGSPYPSLIDMDDCLHRFYALYVEGGFYQWMKAPYVVGLINDVGDQDNDWVSEEGESPYGRNVERWSVEDLLTHNGGKYPTHICQG